VDRTGGYGDAGAHEFMERDHELQASLFGVVSALLDNARVHAAPSPIDVRATSRVVVVR
jgi:hypothetical protein